MMQRTSLTEQQGHYRYDPRNLELQGPSRLFPYPGEDGVLEYIFTTLRQDLLNKGQLSQPWSLLLEQLETAIKKIDENWVQITTLLAWDVFQSGWFNTKLPPNEQFNTDYIRKRKVVLQTIKAFRDAVKTLDAGNDSLTSKEELRSLFYKALEEHATTMPEFHKSLRPVAGFIHERDGGLSDAEFARQRLAAHNPTVIRRVGTDRADLSVLQSWAGQNYNLVEGTVIDLVEAVNANRLFVADYPILQNLKVTDLHAGRYVGSPVAVFYQTDKGLEPILIEVEKGRVVTPAVTDDWTRAKLYVQTADVTHHELIAHLCYTHLAMEAFSITTSRQLPENHPLYLLLKPHFTFLLAINSRGNAILLSEGAAIDKLMAITRLSALDIMNQAYRQRPFADYALPNDIKRRGIEPQCLPDFPYRDDALLIWDAVAKYTSNYLQLYYCDDKDVENDVYLQAWAKELGAPLDTTQPEAFAQVPNWVPKEWVKQTGLDFELPSHPRVPGLGKIANLQQLIDIATTIIFTCGPQHAAVNFSQFDYVNYTPNAPLSLYARPDTPVSLEELLPKATQEVGQMELTYALSGIYYGKFGSSDMIKFASPRDRQILAVFQSDLLAIEEKIQERNIQRKRDYGTEYPYLLPSHIPNSINI
ncbi:MAG: lipoxygenase [Calothrix sp. C42_A2020_038]|nr:lipoxygenase [Calothrix sp. C42_A2020_038]